MIGIKSTVADPAFNLATEEYLLKHTTEEYFYLYTDSPSIICGKHQNALAEINLKSAKDQKIQVFRRLSGGGTVYHDFGNLNFCFITNSKGHNTIDFEGFTAPIIDALNNLGVEAYYGGRSDLLIKGNKISGNACHVYKTRVMHHGTLLFNSNLSALGNTLKTDPTKYTDKAVKSVRSIVTNISDHLKSPMSYEYFKKYLFARITDTTKARQLTDQETEAITSLATNKYATWDWNFGYSPDYNLKRRFTIGETGIQLEFNVHKGVIQNITVLSNREKEALTSIFEKLIGEKHQYETISETIGSDLENKIGLNPDETISFLF